MLTKRKHRHHTNNKQRFLCSMIQQTNRITAEIAEELAVRALQYVAGDQELLGRFMALTGIMPDDLRKIADSAEFRAGLLEFIISDEPTLLAFAASIGEKPQIIAGACAVLSGEVEESAGQ